MTSHLQIGKRRLEAFLDEILQLTQSEFPYESSRKALFKITDTIEGALRDLSTYAARRASDPGLIDDVSKKSLQVLYSHLPLLGFILRSTNTRNAFELYGPILRLARGLLEPEKSEKDSCTELLLSSEWDYSPFLRMATEELPGFLLIGFPAPESSNPLLAPIAGHEIGHAVWANIGDRYKVDLKERSWKIILKTIKVNWEIKYKNRINLALEPSRIEEDLIAYNTLALAADLAVGQAEETFCDIFALKIFGTSYLHALAYLIAPDFPSAPTYPRPKIRAQNLIRAASDLGLRIPQFFKDLFFDVYSYQYDPLDQVLVELAETAHSSLFEILLKKAEDTVAATNLVLPSEKEKKRILQRFSLGMPAEDVKSLADIINAGWEGMLNPKFWGRSEQLKDRKEQALKELILKNVEIFEIQTIMGPNR